MFSSALNGTTNVDHLTDFDVLEDKILLHYLAFPGFAENTMMLTATSFHIGVSATTISQRIVYNPATGALSYDADGTGPVAAVRFARLPAGLALTSQSFMIWPHCGGRIVCP